MNDQDTKVKPADDFADFIPIVTQRFMYNVEECGTKPLVGYLLNRIPMPPIKNRPWDAFVIKTTRPTLGVGRDKLVVDVPVDSEILIPATYELQQFLTRAAAQEQSVFEVIIARDKKIEIGGGQEMWTYKLGHKKTPIPRNRFGLAAVLGSQPTPAQLGQGDGAKDGDIPF